MRMHRCRPEWAALGRQPGERAAGYEARLKAMFSFSSAAAAAKAGSNGKGSAGHINIIPARVPAASKPPAQQQAAAAACHASKPVAATQKLPRSSSDRQKPGPASLLERKAAGQKAAPCSSGSMGGRQQQQQLKKAPVIGVSGSKGAVRPATAALGEGCSKCRFKPGGCGTCNPGFPSAQKPSSSAPTTSGKGKRA